LKTIYLDHNAGTPLLPEVVDAMLPFLRDHYGNPSSNHALGRAARAAVERAREQVALLLGCDAAEVVFTSGGTEANNLAILGVTQALTGRRHVATSLIEHPAVVAPCASTTLDEVDHAAAALARAWGGLARPGALDQRP
jgi:cysteine desulfurase